LVAREREREREGERGREREGENGDGGRRTRGGTGSLKVELVVNRAVAKQPILFPLLRA